MRHQIWGVCVIETELNLSIKTASFLNQPAPYSELSTQPYKSITTLIHYARFAKAPFPSFRYSPSQRLKRQLLDINSPRSRRFLFNTPMFMSFSSIRHFLNVPEKMKKANNASSSPWLYGLKLLIPGSQALPGLLQLLLVVRPHLSHLQCVTVICKFTVFPFPVTAAGPGRQNHFSLFHLFSNNQTPCFWILGTGYGPKISNRFIVGLQVRQSGSASPNIWILILAIVPKCRGQS